MATNRKTALRIRWTPTFPSSTAPSMVAEPGKRVHAKAAGAFLEGNSPGCGSSEVGSWKRRPRLGSLAAALLVLLTGAAGAGVVAADLRAAAEGLGRFRLCRASQVLQFLLLAALPAFERDCGVGQRARAG